MTTNFCSEKILIEEFVKDFRIRVVKIVEDFRIDSLKSSKDFLSMFFLVVDLVDLADLIDDDEIASSSDETSRFDKIL